MEMTVVGLSLDEPVQGPWAISRDWYVSLLTEPLVGLNTGVNAPAGADENWSSNRHCVPYHAGNTLLAWKDLLWNYTGGIMSSSHLSQLSSASSEIFLKSCYVIHRRHMALLGTASYCFSCVRLSKNFQAWWKLEKRTWEVEGPIWLPNVFKLLALKVWTARVPLTF